MDIIRKSGAWFSYGEQRIGQGRENTKNYLKDNPDVAAEIENKIRTKLFEQKSKEDASDDLSDEVIAYRPVETTKDAARAKIDVMVDDDE